MGVERIDHKGGAGRAKIVCDDCGRDEVIPCAYVGNANARSNVAQPNVSQAHKKAHHMGWSIVKNVMRCPACEAKRKVVPMKAAEKTPEAKTAPREASKRQRIEIFTMLAEVYDLDAGRYKKGETDDTVAEVLGVMPGWVSQIRDAEFGPDGGNDDIEALGKAFEESRLAWRELLTQLEAAGDEVKRIETEMKAHKDRMDSAIAKLAAIKKAVGPRILAKAGVS